LSTYVDRMAENEVRFREANERIERVATDYGITEPLPFLCECERENCTDVLRLAPDDYEQVRANPRAFIYAPGHEEGTATKGTVVGRNGGYLVVEKHGVGGEIAEATNPRETAD
jgi:hypothetical protein